MTDPSLIADLIRAGLDPDLVARVSNAIASNVVIVSGGIPVETAIEKRREWDRNRKRQKRLSGGIPVETGGIPQSALTTIEDKNIKILSKRERATRIPPEWDLSADDRKFAADRGMQAPRISTEAEKFKNYWMAATGRTSTSPDWPAKWRTWVLKSLTYQPGELLAISAPAASGTPQPPSPDLPSHEELLKKYANVKPGNYDERTGLRRESLGVLQEHARPERAPPSHKTRNGGMVQLGALFQGIPGLHPDRHEAGPMGPEPSDDGAGPMA